MCIKDYEILNKDKIVAVWKNQELQVINDALLPLFLKRVSNADKWLETRAVDSHRANSRLLKKALRMAEKDDVATVILANGVTITDNYWVRAIGSSLKYDDVRLDDSRFARATSNVAFSGKYSSFNYVAEHKPSKTPELTLVGSFEKCWKVIDGKWWMIKKANNNEAFSEIFISNLGKLIGMDIAEYVRTDQGVRTLDFTSSAEVNFEPALAYMGEEEDYEENIRRLEKICPHAIEGYIKMIFLDALVANPDRHTGNYGLLRNSENGELIGFAPLFDHNMALISREYPKLPARSDMLISLFVEVIKDHQDFKKYIPEITREIVNQAINMTNGKVKTKVVEEFVIGRYEIIRNRIE